MYRLAGIAGQNPDPFTLRELIWLAEGRQRDDWSRTAVLAAFLWNDPQGVRPRKSIDEFNPFTEQDNQPSAVFKITSPVDLAALMGTTTSTVQ